MASPDEASSATVLAPRPEEARKQGDHRGLGRRDGITVLGALLVALSELEATYGAEVGLSALARHTNMAYDRVAEHLKPLVAARLIIHRAATVRLTQRGFEFLRVYQNWIEAVRRSGLPVSFEHVRDEAPHDAGNGRRGPA